MTVRSAWVLNLDAEYELASPDAHTPSARTLGLTRYLVHSLALLFGPHDVVLGEAGTLDRDDGPWTGRAWCPTPRALRRLATAGATPVAAPDVGVLRRVNHRRFNAELGQTLPGACFVTSMDELKAVTLEGTPSGQWLLKRPLAFAGRGRRRVARGALDAADVAWIEASLRRGDGLQVEPWVERTADYGLHGFVASDGIVTMGRPTRQHCDASGAWRATARATDLEPNEDRMLYESARLAADALLGAGYFGPFGIDAYRWRDGATIQFNARSEINARYSMGWAVGMQGLRVDRV